MLSPLILTTNLIGMCYYYVHFTSEHAEVQNGKEKSSVTWLINGESGIQTQVRLTPVAACLPHYPTPPFLVP